MKRAIALLLSLMLAFSCLPMAALAAFSDEASWPSSASWAKEEIEYMVGKGILNGYAEDNSFHPEWPVTRVQFIKMMVETFGLTNSTSINYADVAATDWFYPYVAKAAAQGFLLNYGSYLDPNGALSRQEAAALLASYLNLSEKVGAATYPDYNSIKANYRDYVLAATHAGLFSGDAETGNFSPDRTLKRCEAAAILYRAAGTIYKASATGTEADAHGENAVIGSSGITVTGATVKGKLLITEGASGGTITLSGCDVETLVLRGTASLVLSGSAVDEIIVEPSASGYTASVSLSSSASVGALTAKTPVEISTVTRTSIQKLNIESTAKNSSVTGAGTLGNVTVKAAGFTAEQLPTKYTVQSGITAKFNGTSYSGSSADASATGFSAIPSTYATSAACYLAAKPSVGGTLYYYFTNTADAPVSSTYTNYYTAASVKSYLTVSANTSVDQKISDTVNVSGYAYVVVMLQNAQGTKYQPLVLANKSSSGFVATPTVSTSGTYEQISFKTTVDGTLYYYYTNTETAPTASGFTSGYNNNSTDSKGEIDVFANRAETEDTFLTNKVSSYKYVAVLIVDDKGNQYQPLLLAKDAKGDLFVGNGFTTTPYSDVSANEIMLGFAAGVSGTVEYYYTNTAAVPTTEQFDKALEDLSEILVGEFSATGGAAYHQSLSNQVVARAMSYLVVRLRAFNGTVYQPVVVTLPDTDAAALNGTGFSAMPTTEVNSGYFSVNVQTSYVGRVYYYVTDNERAPANASIFRVNYEGATAKELAFLNGGMTSVSVGKQTIATPISNEVGREFNYLVLMLETAGVSLTPIIIPLTGATETATVATTTGFIRNPQYTKANQKMAALTMTSSVTGTVWYYFTNDTEIPTPEELVALAGIEAGSGYGGTVRVIANQSSTKNFSTAYQHYPAYIIVMLQDSNGMYYQPVLLATSGDGSSTSGIVNATASGFATVPTARTTGSTTTLSYNALSASQVYYYFTNTATAPTTSDAFFVAHIGAPSNASGIFAVSAAGTGTEVMTVFGYSYMVLMVQTAGAQISYYTPIIIPTNGSSTSVTTSGFYSTPTLVNGVLNYYPTTTGTLYYCFTDADNESEFYADLPGLQGGSITGSTAGGIMQFISGSKPITSVGPQSLNILSGSSSYVQMLMTYDYVAVWIASGSMKTDIVFVPTSSSSSNTISNTGFLSRPTVNTTLSGQKTVVINPSVAGTVYYFFTTSTTTYTAETFFSGHINANNGSTLTNAVAAQQQSISVNSSYKYMWLMLKTDTQSYTPVVVTLY